MTYTLVSHYISSRHTLFMLTIYLQHIAFTTYSLWVQDISARHIWHGILFYMSWWYVLSVSRHILKTYQTEVCFVCLEGMCWNFQDISSRHMCSSRHICQIYMSWRYVLKYVKTYPQDIYVLQDISASYICLEGMYWNMSRRTLKTYVFFKTYPQDIHVNRMLHMSWRYVLKYVTTYPQDICVLQDISSRHICQQNVTYVLKVCIEICHDVSSRHMCVSRHILKTYKFCICLDDVSRHIFKTYNFSRHTVNTYIS